MSRARLKRKVATMRAVMWLNTFRESINSGVLRIDSTLSHERKEQIARELASFRDAQLPRINRDLGLAPDIYATCHLKRWEEDSAAEVEPYPLTRLLTEQNRHCEGAESLRRALEIVKSEDLSDSDNTFILRLVLTRAASFLIPNGPDVESSAEPGVVGERIRDCEEAIEVALNNIRSLRKNEYDFGDACALSETCAVLHERAFQLVKHIREKGLV